MAVLHLRILILQLLMNTKLLSLNIREVCDPWDIQIPRQRGLGIKAKPVTY